MTFCEKCGKLLCVICGCVRKQFHHTARKLAGVAELADAQDLGSCVNSCRFDPCHPHQNQQEGLTPSCWFLCSCTGEEPLVVALQQQLFARYHSILFYLQITRANVGSDPCHPHHKRRYAFAYRLFGFMSQRLVPHVQSDQVILDTI